MSLVHDVCPHRSSWCWLFSWLWPSPSWQFSLLWRTSKCSCAETTGPTMCPMPSSLCPSLCSAAVGNSAANTPGTWLLWYGPKLLYLLLLLMDGFLACISLISGVVSMYGWLLSVCPPPVHPHLEPVLHGGHDRQLLQHRLSHHGCGHHRGRVLHRGALLAAGQ